MRQPSFSKKNESLFFSVHMSHHEMLAVGLLEMSRKIVRMP